MKSHSDFVVGKGYDCPDYGYDNALCIGHSSDGRAVVELSDRSLHKVGAPTNWRPAPKVYKRYVFMYPSGPGNTLHSSPPTPDETPLSAIASVEVTIEGGD